MSRLFLIATLVIGSCTQAWAGFPEGEAAYSRGDFKKAFSEYLILALKGEPTAQILVGTMIDMGQGVPGDHTEAVKWFRMAAEQGNDLAQGLLGVRYEWGKGVPRNYTEAAKWYRLSAQQGNQVSQYSICMLLTDGQRAPRDYAQAGTWCQLAAEGGYAAAMGPTAIAYNFGLGLHQDFIRAYMWSDLAIAELPDSDERDELSKVRRNCIEHMTSEQLVQAQELVRKWRPKSKEEQSTHEEPRRNQPSVSLESPSVASSRRIEDTGTGFVVSKAGHVLTNFHVVGDCAEVRLRSPQAKSVSALLLARDERNDLALLRSIRRPEAVATFREGKGLRQGDEIVVYGFPLAGALASEGNLTTGTVSALSGVHDDERVLQITAPVQPGNSGGPLLDKSGNVVGLVTSKLDALKVAGVTGDIPQNINFAIKGSLVQGFLDTHRVGYESRPPEEDRKTADIGDEAKEFTVLVECWR